MTARSPRTQKMDLRLSPEAKDALVRAAALEHRSVSDFVLASALARAHETLGDRQRFVLSDEAFDAFLTALDAPSVENTRLKQLLLRPSPFDQA